MSLLKHRTSEPLVFEEISLHSTMSLLKRSAGDGLWNIVKLYIPLCRY